MGKKTSVYLPDDLADAVAASGAPLADLIRLGLTAATPRLIEPPEGDRTWITWWFCDVPEMGARFHVLLDEWHTFPDGVPVRKIYKIKVSDTAG